MRFYVQPVIGALIFLLFIPAVGSARSDPTILERYLVISNGKVSGRLLAKTGGPEVEISYDLSENGRGPSTREHILLNANGLPHHWQVSGRSKLGPKLNEVFDMSPNRAVWRSESDVSSAPAAAKLYLSEDASPWALGLYARAALSSAGNTISLFPGGVLTATRIGTEKFDFEGSEMKGIFYRLSGPWAHSKYLLLDQRGALLAWFGEEQLTLMREGLEAHEGKLQAIAAQLELDDARALQQKLSHRFNSPIRIENVRVFDPRSGTVGPLNVVTVYRDRIASVLPDTPDNPRQSGEVIVDGQGGVLIPGLHDMHSHTSVYNCLTNLAAGVTTTRDMGNNAGFLLDLTDRLDRGEVAGPRVVRNGFIEGVSPYSATTGLLVASLPEALDGIHWYADRGYWQLKIYNSIDPDWVKPMAAQAHRLGMGVTGHVPAFTTADRVIQDGYDEIAHINQLMLQWVLQPGEDTRTTLRVAGLNRLADVDLDSPRVKKTFALMREHHTVLDTTAVIYEWLLLSQAGIGEQGDASWLSHVPIGDQREEKQTFVVTHSDAERRRYVLAFDQMLKTIKSVHDNGNRLMPGTDLDGFAIHRELELYVTAGISPAEVLRLDTLGAAEYLGQDQELGSIERGKYADMVLLPGDPTANISQVRHARMVMRGGTIYFPDEIYKSLNIRPFSSSPAITLPLNH